MPPSVRPSRHFRQAAALLLAVALFAVTAPAQTPPARTGYPVEEEDPAAVGRPLKRVAVDDDPTPADVPDGVYFVPLPAVGRAMAAAKHPVVNAYLSEFTVASDRLVDARNRAGRVTPVPLLWPEDRAKFPAEFGVVPLDARNRPGEAVAMAPKAVRRLDPFERLALAETDKLLALPRVADKPSDDPPPPMAERLAAAEVVIGEVLLFHETARDRNRRRGKAWDAVRVELADRLTKVRLDRLAQAAADRDWPLVQTLAGRLTERYAGDARVLARVSAARLAEAEELAKSPRADDLKRVRALLTEYDARSPGSADDAAGRVRKALVDRAKALFEEAERLSKTSPAEAQNLLKTVELLHPDLPGLRDTQRELRAGYGVLVVGTRRLPERMTPTAARWDSERQAVELVFEGLYQAVPDGELGVRYVPGLAADRPAAGGGVREVPLARAAAWAGADAGYLDPADVAETVRLTRQKPDTWAADPLDWLDDPSADPADPARLRVPFRRGHPDPRALLTFKVLPGRWLQTRGKGVDDAEFARRPVGTGPFRLSPDYRPPGPNDPPRDVVFLSNPGYARRPGKAGLPGIKEVRFTDLSRLSDPPAEFQSDRLHLLSDVPTAELARYESGGNLGGRVQVVTAANPRRVHVLAVNHRRPTLRSADLRRGLSLAVDREKALTDVFRAGRAEFHRPMTGPFPPDCWATPKAVAPTPDPLFNRDLAAAKLKAYRAAGGPAKLPLAYPDDDPQAKSACERLKADVDATAADFTVEMEPLPPAEFYRAVVEQHRFDLAYLPFDYPDDWYPLRLAAALDPTAAGLGGRNTTGYLGRDSTPAPADEQLARLLAEARLYRDPARLTAVAHQIHRRFADAMPFVPLWQLDRHLVISSAVKVHLDGQPGEASPKLLDPGLLFTSAALWEMK